MPKSQFTDAYGIFVQTFIAARKRARLSQVEVAKRIGRDQPFVSLVERGVRRVDVIEFCVFARALGTTPEALMAEVSVKLPAEIQI